MLAERLTPGARVLDLGCGPGVPVLAMLSERFQVVGVDVSLEMLKLAREKAPRATLVRGDMRSIAFRPASFQAVACLSALFHIPRDDHATVLENLANWTCPRGTLVVATGARSDPGSIDPAWLGVGPMFWSFHDPETTTALVESAGFLVEESAVHEQDEGGYTVPFLWIVARKQ